MKQALLILTICLLNICAHARPNYTDASQAIPLGSKLTVGRLHIDLPPKTDKLYFNANGMEASSEAFSKISQSGIVCLLDFTPTAHERYIRAGTEYEITKVSTYQGKNGYLVLNINSRVISQIRCIANPNTPGTTKDGSISINLLVSTLAKYFELNLAPPELVF